MKQAAVNEDFEEALMIKRKIQEVSLASREELCAKFEVPKTIRDLMFELIDWDSKLVQRLLQQDEPPQI